jgi:hypothetical protein
MNARPQTAESPIHYFVDEAGDPTLFNRKGRVIVGDGGCSRYFMLGKLEISEPEVLSAQLAALRQELVADPYFKAVPSMRPGNRKTALAFHAKDDVSEVRRRICFAKRGNKTRNAAFREALKAAAGAFAASFGFAHPATNDVVSSTPPHCPGLQAVDYYLWALQRFIRAPRGPVLGPDLAAGGRDPRPGPPGGRATGGVLHKTKAAQSGGL